MPDSPRFRLDGAGDKPIWKKSLHANWVMCSFGYGNVHQHVHFLQPKTGSTNGDIRVTRKDTAGNQPGSTAPHDFGQPQGMSVRLSSAGSRPAFGMYSRTNDVRQASVFYESTLVQSGGPADADGPRPPHHIDKES
ncbi:hypothetical protein [Streptomyces sp. NBC_01216]|uniref:hypothetical protein n=1 Tax=unclassified Streptomyces TaxID=2593676 RepID=UPI002E15446F|nr:hypothetical protein OG393_09130 [Streptomyces sp. NBC_01216]